MMKRTMKVGIVGRYGTRYGASLKRQIKKMKVSQHHNSFVSSVASMKRHIKRNDVGTWGCKDCGKVKVGEGLPFF
ncbi:putative ribosomal protein L37ae [Helianthus anomalus]